MHKGTVHACCDAGDMGTIVDRGVDSLVVEKGVIRLGQACEEARVGVESGVELLKRRAADERTVRTRWALNAEWAWLYTRRRETLEPRMAGNEWRAARTHARRREVVERVR